jgi:putative membrane protein insertion efficiency factor
MSVILKKLFRMPILFYRRFISPLLPNSCRFYPSCSEYALEAIEKHGALKGMFLSIMRILRCNPFHSGGYDPLK